ncbi:MAG: heavy metal translocating P-type ATPase [Halieaceae bacterium]|nr:heavy metal translocating P-type ATPase [Halieaceae bacterium]
MTAEKCFHCGDDMPPGCDYTVEIDGEDQPVCCIGCQSVALMIRGADLTAFYRQRTEYPPTPTDDAGETASWFDDANWVSGFATTDNDGHLVVPLLVTGMSCAACTWLIERALNECDGVLDVDINLNLSRLALTLETNVSAAPAVAMIERLGYQVRPWRTDDRLDQLRADNRRDIRRLGVAGLGMMQAGMFAVALHAGDMQGIDEHMQGLLRWFSAPIALFVVIYSGRSFFINAWKSLLQKHLIMDSSVSLALLLATGASLWATVRGSGETYYDSVTMFVFFLLLARFVEKRLRDADLLALVRIEDRLPEFVAQRIDEEWQRVPRATVPVGALVRIPAGESIAFDAVICRGESTVDEAVFTGEAVPRHVTEGDKIFAGTINRDASVEAVVSSAYRDSKLAALQDDVDRARRGKPPYLKLIDRIAGRFVAVVVLAAAATAIGWMTYDPSHALWSALAVLVVACPCALSLATPAALASATAWLRRHNVLVHGEFGLLASADITSVLIDKTGTLTETRLKLDKIALADHVDRDTAIALASALQQFSNHPAAQPFHGLTTLPGVENVEAVPGKGMRGQWQHGEIRLGSAGFCAELCAVPAPPDEVDYWIALVDARGWIAWLGLGESLRPDAEQLIASLKKRGASPRIVSGDSDSRVAHIASQLSIPFTAAASPADKLALIQQLQSDGETVLAIGDGLNDAPLLSAAEASVAVASATALTRAQADFAIDEENLLLIPVLLDISTHTRRIIRQNLVWAAGYNLIGIPFAAAGYVPPWLAAVGMSLSSLLVVLNALRLRRFRRREP